MASREHNSKIPTFEKFMNPILQTLYRKGGSGTIKELYDSATETMQLSDEVASIPHGKSGRTEVQYRIAWALTYLKRVGLLTNSSRGVWSLSNPKNYPEVDGYKIRKQVVDYFKDKREEKKGSAKTIEKEIDTTDEESDSWQTTALDAIHHLTPDAFERLCQRLLRESGFIEVEVTGRSGDGGIDGHGILRLAGLVSFRVLFQSKKHRGTISAPLIRNFRGAMIGRADRGLFITTGTFTKDAQREATRDGAPLMDLVDGELLIEKLKEFNMGISTRQVEEVVVEKEWFDKI